jgi:hypothetical protein
MSNPHGQGMPGHTPSAKTSGAKCLPVDNLGRGFDFVKYGTNIHDRSMVPLNSYQAESRLARFFRHGHTPDPICVAPTRPNPDFLLSNFGRFEVVSKPEFRSEGAHG